MTPPNSREVPVVPAETALLFIDVQTYCAARGGGEFTHLSLAELDARCGYYFDRLEAVAVPNMQRLQAGCRAAGIEVMYTLIENLTADLARDDTSLWPLIFAPTSLGIAAVGIMLAAAGRPALLRRVRRPEVPA